ncbi:MAG: hypothetical protein ACRDPG_13615 [Nocardioidaceae bacterium]
MRSNGLTAPSYTPVADLDPRIADALLEELKGQGVAAYTNPVESTSTAGFDRPEFRVDVKERLYVDTAASARVRDLIARRDPDLGAPNDDLTWAQIVAEFDQPVTSDVSPWPVTEDLDWHSADHDASERGPLDTHDDPPTDAAGFRLYDDGSSASGVSSDDDVEDRFIPPTPPPLPKIDGVRQAAWIGALGGPLLLVGCALFSVSLPTWLALIAVGGFIAGFVTLVATMNNDPDRGDGDNGAVV